MLALVHFWTCHAVLQVNTSQRADFHHSIMPITMTTDKAMSCCRHSSLASVQSAAVASWASDCAGVSVYLRAIWPDKSLERVSRGTRSAASCSQHWGLWQYRVQGWQWEASSGDWFSMNVLWSVQKQKLTMGETSQSVYDFFQTLMSSFEHFGIRLTKWFKGHVSKYYLCSLALVEPRLSLCDNYASDWLSVCQPNSNWHHTHTHKYRASNPANPPCRLNNW